MQLMGAVTRDTGGAEELTAGVAVEGEVLGRVSITGGYCCDCLPMIIEGGSTRNGEWGRVIVFFVHPCYNFLQLVYHEGRFQRVHIASLNDDVLAASGTCDPRVAISGALTVGSEIVQALPTEGVVAGEDLGLHEHCVAY